MKISVKDGCPECPIAGFAITLLDHNGNPLARVQEFDTETMLGIIKVADFVFGYPEGNLEYRDKLLKELPPEWCHKVMECGPGILVAKQ